LHHSAGLGIDQIESSKGANLIAENLTGKKEGTKKNKTENGTSITHHFNRS
tara:strand:- start:405 stop:557 length:153 start_codon:yes stop_codon:yes gene_type:complete